MNKLTDRSPMSQTDKLCLVALAGVILTAALADWAMDAAAYRAVEADKPQVEMVEIVKPIDCTPLAAAMEAMQEDPYREDIPLSRELQAALYEVCSANDVAPCLVLGVIWAESRFDPEADNGLCYGYMGLNRNYYPSDLTPAENIQAGVIHLAGQLERYGGDIQAALTAYNAGYDTGSRTYAKKVLDASEKWGKG